MSRVINIAESEAMTITLAPRVTTANSYLIDQERYTVTVGDDGIGSVAVPTYPDSRTIRYNYIVPRSTGTVEGHFLLAAGDEIDLLELMAFGGQSNSVQQYIDTSIRGAHDTDPTPPLSDVTRQLSNYESLGEAIELIGDENITVWLDADTPVSTVCSVPSGWNIVQINNAMFIKDGGSIAFTGYGLNNPLSETPVFSGLGAGDVTWTGANYPRHVSTELLDAGDSLTDRINFIDAAFLGKPMTIEAYPRTQDNARITITQYHNLHLNAGEYPSNFNTPYSTAFVYHDDVHIYGDGDETVVYEGSGNNVGIMGAWHMVEPGHSTEACHNNVIEKIRFKATSLTNVGWITVLFGNAANSEMLNCTFEYTKGYNVIGGYGSGGNYADGTYFRDNKFIGCATQVVAFINSRNCGLIGACFDQRNSAASGPTNYTIIDVEANEEFDKNENLVIADIEINMLDRTDGTRYPNGISVNGASGGGCKNITVRNVRMYGPDPTVSPTTNYFSTGISLRGVCEAYVHDNVVRYAGAKAFTVDMANYVRFYNNDAFQCADSGGLDVALSVTSCANSDFERNRFSKSLAALTQADKIIETERDSLISTSGAVITNLRGDGGGANILFYDFYKGLTFLINNTLYTISSVADQLTMTASASIGTLGQRTVVSISGDEITLNAAHNYNTGAAVWFYSDATTIGGLTSSTTYYAIVTSSTKMKLASTKANALASTAINLTSVGTGTRSIYPVMQTRFSNNNYKSNKTGGITVAPTGTSTVS